MNDEAEVAEEADAVAGLENSVNDVMPGNLPAQQLMWQVSPVQNLDKISRVTYYYSQEQTVCLNTHFASITYGHSGNLVLNHDLQM